jgi:small subunit ribosomal protein S16
MVKIRLRRIGLRNQPSFRIVATEKESPNDGRFLEILGSYNPRTEPFSFEAAEDRVFYWLSKGAQPSESVSKLFNAVGLLERYKKFKAGEPVEKLLQEATEFYQSRIVDVKTKKEQASK